MTTVEGKHPAVSGREVNANFQNVAVAIPAFNEQKRIGEVVRGCVATGCGLVWVVEDGSSDQTAEQATRAGASVLKHSSNLGKGMAIRTALKAFADSKFEYLIFLDADGQHDP